MLKSFIDVMFILLCAAVALLSRTVYVGTAEAEAAKIGGETVSSSESRLVAVVVRPDALLVEGRDVGDDPSAVAGAMGEGPATAVLIPSDAGVAHHRVMEVWAALGDLGVDAKLAAAPREAGEKEGR